MYFHSFMVLGIFKDTGVLWYWEYQSTKSTSSRWPGDPDETAGEGGREDRIPSYAPGKPWSAGAIPCHPPCLWMEIRSPSSGFQEDIRWAWSWAQFLTPGPGSVNVGLVQSLWQVLLPRPSLYQSRNRIDPMAQTLRLWGSQGLLRLEAGNSWALLCFPSSSVTLVWPQLLPVK